jgi:hypothetical protein
MRSNATKNQDTSSTNASRVPADESDIHATAAEYAIQHNEDIGAEVHHEAANLDFANLKIEDVEHAVDELKR